MNKIDIQDYIRALAIIWLVGAMGRLIGWAMDWTLFEQVMQFPWHVIEPMLGLVFIDGFWNVDDCGDSVIFDFTSMM